MRKVDRTKEPSLCLQGSDTMTYTYDAQGNLTRSVLEYYGYEQARSDHTYNPSLWRTRPPYSRK